MWQPYYTVYGKSQQIKGPQNGIPFTFTFTHLADAFIQSDLQIRKSN